MKPSEKFWCRISVDIIHGQNVEGKSERLIFRRMSRCASLYWPPPKGSELEQMLAPDVLKRWNFDIFRQHISNLYDHTVRAAVLNQRAISEIHARLPGSTRSVVGIRYSGCSWPCCTPTTSLLPSPSILSSSIGRSSIACVHRCCRASLRQRVGRRCASVRRRAADDRCTSIW